MIVIQLAGGLGNQMFQYALCLQLKSLGKDVRIDDVTGFVQDAKRDPVLAFFGISYEHVSKKELEQMLDSSPLLWNKIRRKLFGRKRKSYFEEDKCYHPEIMTWDDIYLEGYWQTEKYFESVEDEVRRAFDTEKLLEYLEKDSLGKAVQANADKMSVEYWLQRITAAESVSVHIRRGDYLLPENQRLFGNICTEAYYRKAMNEMRQNYPECRFFLFTNDKEWMRERLNAYEKTSMGSENESTIDTKDIEIVDMGKQNDYAEFVLMSKCRHNILANSSFGWWASYLNKNPDKTVLVPDIWLNGWDCEDIYRKDMKKVEA